MYRIHAGIHAGLDFACIVHTWIRANSGYFSDVDLCGASIGVVCSRLVNAVSWKFLLWIVGKGGIFKPLIRGRRFFTHHNDWLLAALDNAHVLEDIGIQRDQHPPVLLEHRC